MPKHSEPVLAMLRAIKPVTDYMERKADFGASDTEPRAAFHCVLREAAMNHDYPEVQWEVFQVPGGAAVERKLDKLAQKAHGRIVEALWAMPVPDALEAEEYLRDYCWRVDWR